MKLQHMIALSVVLLALTACTAQVVQPAIDNSVAPVVEAAARRPGRDAGAPGMATLLRTVVGRSGMRGNAGADGLRGAGRPDHHAGADA